MPELKSYRVWDVPTRWFHWINAICVVALVVVGYLILSGRALEIPLILSHLYSYYGLLAVVALHILGVVITEIRDGGSIISATFTGRKIISGRPVDEEPSSGGQSSRCGQ
jgi:cytochrome b